MTDRNQTVAVRDTQIACTDEGAGPAIVLLHGHAYDRSMWNEQVPELVQAGWRVIAPDLRGFGDSEVTAGIVYTEEFADDIDALLESLEVPRAVVLGFSMAGQVAMELTHRHPTRVRALIICDTVPQAEDTAGRRRRHVTADSIVTGGMDAYAEKVLSVMVSPATVEQRAETAETVRRMIAAAPAEGSAAAMRGRAERRDFRDLLPAMDIPSLVVAGSEDAFDNGAAQSMVNLLPQGRLVTIPSAGHTPPMETPREFTEALLEFLQPLASGAA